MQVVQLQVLTIFSDLINMQESPSSGPNLPIEHAQALRLLIPQLPESMPLAQAARSLSTLLCNSLDGSEGGEESLFALIMDPHVSEGIAAAGIAHVISQGDAALAGKGVVQALQRFGAGADTVKRCLLNFPVCHPCPARSRHRVTLHDAHSHGRQ